VVPLVALALIDSTSFGTLLVPLWLMLAPGRLRPGRVVLFLFTVAGFYLAFGVALGAGATRMLDRLDETMTSEPVRVIQSVVGFGLVVAGITLEPWSW
jgi:NhaP-type Na+/H+ or K+/H+ antiporter